MKLLFLIFTLIYFTLGYNLKYIGSFRTPNPAFLKVKKLSSEEPPSLLITSFNGEFFKPGYIRIVKNVGDALKQNVSQIRPLDIAGNGLIWPNEIDLVPNGVFKDQKFLWY